jgi:hypothetical protein
MCVPVCVIAFILVRIVVRLSLVIQVVARGGASSQWSPFLALLSVSVFSACPTFLFVPTKPDVIRKRLELEFVGPSQDPLFSDALLPLRVFHEYLKYLIQHGAAGSNRWCAEVGVDPAAISVSISCLLECASKFPRHLLASFHNAQSLLDAVQQCVPHLIVSQTPLPDARPVQTLVGALAAAFDPVHLDVVRMLLYKAQFPNVLKVTLQQGCAPDTLDPPFDPHTRDTFLGTKEKPADTSAPIEYVGSDGSIVIDIKDKRKPIRSRYVARNVPRLVVEAPNMFDADSTPFTVQAEPSISMLALIGVLQTNPEGVILQAGDQNVRDAPPPADGTRMLTNGHATWAAKARTIFFGSDPSSRQFNIRLSTGYANKIGDGAKQGWVAIAADETPSLFYRYLLTARVAPSGPELAFEYAGASSPTSDQPLEPLVPLLRPLAGAGRLGGPLSARSPALHRQWLDLRTFDESLFVYALPAILKRDTEDSTILGRHGSNQLTVLPCSTANARLRSSVMLLLAAPPAFGVLSRDLPHGSMCVGLFVKDQVSPQFLSYEEAFVTYIPLPSTELPLDLYFVDVLPPVAPLPGNDAPARRVRVCGGSQLRELSTTLNHHCARLTPVPIAVWDDIVGALRAAAIKPASAGTLLAC